MNALDYVCIITCAAFLALGAHQGLIRSVSSLAALLTGLYSAKKIEPLFSHLLARAHIPNPGGILGYLVVFLCIFVSIKIVLFYIQKLLKASGMSVLDRAFGAVLGLVKGIVVAVFAFTILQLALPKGSAILTNSEILPYSNRFVTLAGAFLPDTVYRHFGKT